MDNITLVAVGVIVVLVGPALANYVRNVIVPLLDK